MYGYRGSGRLLYYREVSVALRRSTREIVGPSEGHICMRLPHLLFMTHMTPTDPQAASLPVS
jgi:hypothetical protein